MHALENLYLTYEKTLFGCAGKENRKGQKIERNVHINLFYFIESHESIFKTFRTSLLSKCGIALYLILSFF